MYKLFKKHGRMHVLVGSSREGNYTEKDFKTGEEIDAGPIPEANFCNTGMALTGVLRPGETLEAWKIRKQETKVRIREENKNDR